MLEASSYVLEGGTRQAAKEFQLHVTVNDTKSTEQ